MSSPKWQPVKRTTQIANAQTKQMSVAVAVRHARALPCSALHPADILVFQRMVGNQTVQSTLAAPMQALGTTKVAERLIIQRTLNFVNTNTNERAALSITDSRLEVNLSSRAEPWGYADINIAEDALHVRHIESHPEHGSGLGALFLFYSAKKALAAGKEIIRVDLATADTARGFYTHMGFGPDPEAMQDWVNATGESVNEVKVKYGHLLPLAGSALEVFAKASLSFTKRWTPV